MGLEPFEVRFFFTKIHSIRSSAHESHQKSFKICLRTMRNVFNDMTEEFFLCQNSYGNTTRFKIFYTQKIFSVTVPGPGRYPNQKLFRYDQRSSYMILGKRGNFGESKLLWACNGLRFIFKRFFRLC